MHLQSSSSGSVPSSSSPSKPPRRRKNGGLPPPRPRCNECGKDFSNQSALSKHKLTHSDVRRFSCQLCGKAFKRQDHLNGHMLTHRDKKPYECDVEGCEKTYCDARSLRRHKENHHNQSVQPRISGPGGIGGGLPPLPLPGMLPNGSLVNGFSALMSMTGGCNSLPPPAGPSVLSPNSSYSQISPSSYDPQQQQHPHYPRSHMNGSVSGGGNSGIAQSNGPNMPSSSGVGDGPSAAGYHNNFSSSSGHLLPHQQPSSQQQPPPPSPSYSTCSQPQSSPYDLHAPAPHLRGVGTPATPQTPSTPTTPGISGGGPLYQHKVQEYLAHLPPHHPHNNNRRPVSLPSTPNGDGASVEGLHPPQRQVFTYPSVSPQPPNGNPYHHQVPPPSQHHQQHQVHHHNGHHPSHHHVENLHPSDVSSPDTWTASANDGGYSSSYHQHHPPQHPLTPPCNLATNSHHNGDHHHLNDLRRAHSLPSTPVDPNDPSFSYNHVNHSSPYQPQQHHQDLPSPYDTQHPPPHLQSHGGQHHQPNGGRTALHFRQPPPPLTLHQGMACLPEEEDEHDKLLPLTPQDVDDVLGEGEGGGRTENFVFPTAPSTTAPSSSMEGQLTLSRRMGKTPSSPFLHNHHPHLSSGKLIAADVVPNVTTIAPSGTDVSLHSSSDVTASIPSLSSVASSSLQQTQSLLHHRQQFSGGKFIGLERTENYSSTTTRMDNTVSVVVPPSKLSSTLSPSSGKGEKKIASCHDDNVTSGNRDNNSSSNTASGSSVASAFKDGSSINTERGKISSPIRMRHKPEPIYIPPHVNACGQLSLTGPSSTPSGPYPSQASRGGTTIRGSPRIWEGKVPPISGSSQSHHLSFSLSGNPNGIVPPPPHLSSSACHPCGGSSSNLYQILTRQQQSSTAEDKERGIESFQHHHHPSSKFSPPPYTPPAMLSPVRTIFGGIYWHINTTPKADRMATSSGGGSPPQSAQKLHFFRSKIVHHPGNSVASIPPPLSIAPGTIVTAPSAEIDIMDVAQTPKTAYEPEADYHLIPETDIQPHVNVGPQFQARIPEFIPNRESAFEKYKNDHADLLWDPKLLDGDDTFLSSDDIDYFIEVACSSCLPGGGRNVEYAYHCLARANGDVQQALLMLLDPEPKILETDPLFGYHYPESDVWSAEEITAYHAALVKCDKDFSAIAREVESKSVKQCIQFYYVWKKVCPDEYRRLRVLRRKREQEGILFRHDSNNNEQKPDPA